MSYQFTVTGKFKERTAAVAWDNGKLSGDPEVVSLVQQSARDREGLVVSVGDFHETETQHLSDPISSYLLIREVLGKDAVITGTFPIPEPLPPGSKR